MQKLPKVPKDFKVIPMTPHNRGMLKSAKSFAEKMQKEPSWLEQKMIHFLEENGIAYKTQHVLYIIDDYGYIDRYYIADFWIPKNNIIIETDGQFHKEQTIEDEHRIKDIQEHYPTMTMIRWETKDFESEENIAELLKKLQ